MDKDAERVFQPYWTEKVTAEFRRPLLTRLLNRLLRDHRGPGAIPREHVAGIRAAIQSDSYGPNFGRFERDMEYVWLHFSLMSPERGENNVKLTHEPLNVLLYREAVAEYAPDDGQQSSSRRLLSEFRALVSELKRSQLKSANKSYSNANGRHRSRVAAAIAKQARERFLSYLAPSCGTLIVIPRVLMEHWQVRLPKAG